MFYVCLRWPAVNEETQPLLTHYGNRHNCLGHRPENQCWARPVCHVMTDADDFLFWNSCNKCTSMLTLQLACSLNSRIAYILKLQQPPVTANISSEHFAWAVVEVEYNTFSQLFYQVFHSPLPTRFWWWDWFLKAVLCGLYKMAGVAGKINRPVMCVELVYGSLGKSSSCSL